MNTFNRPHSQYIQSLLDMPIAKLEGTDENQTLLEQLKNESQSLRGFEGLKCTTAIRMMIYRNIIGLAYSKETTFDTFYNQFKTNYIFKDLVNFYLGDTEKYSVYNGNKANFANVLYNDFEQLLLKK